MKLAKIFWAAPCSVIGMVLALLVVLCGGKARLGARTVEATFRPCESDCGKFVRWLPYRAITLGHVIVAVTEPELNALHSHELAHVAQYERWGVLFFFAYAASGLWQWLRGGNAYRDNYFEVQARALSARPPEHRPAASATSS